MALAGGATTVPAAVSRAAAIAAFKTFKGFMSVSPFPVAYWLIIKPPGLKAGLAFSR